MFKRVNHMGLGFLFFEEKGEKTRVVHEEKTIVVNCSVDEVSQRWYDWQMGGKKIQEAFSNLSPSEREFFMTGMTQKEWDDLFGEPA